MSFLDFVPKTLLVVLALLGVGVAGYYWLDTKGLKSSLLGTEAAMSQLREEHSKLVADAAEREAKLEALYRSREQDLQIKLNSERTLNAAKISSLSADAAQLKLRLAQSTALAGLTLKPTGTGAVAGLGAPAGSVHDAGVPGAIDELVNEAFRADQVRIALLGCYGAYDRAREMLGKGNQ